MGLGFVKHYAALPDHTVISAVRKPESMPQVDCAEGTKIVTVKIDSADTADAKKAVEELKSKHSISSLDIVIANAGAYNDKGALAEVDLGEFEELFKINVVGALALFQACLPLLPKGGKFVWMSSGAGVVSREKASINPTYGSTKATNVFLARYAHHENPDIVSFALSPGWVQTDMGHQAASYAGKKDAASLTVEQSIEGCTNVIEQASRDKWSGLHISYDGSQQPW